MWSKQVHWVSIGRVFVRTISMMSPTTALAVAPRPAPGPANMSCPTGRPLTSTAFWTPSMKASGFRLGTSVGATKANTRLSSCRAVATSLMTHPSSSATSVSRRVTPRMPSVRMSAGVIRVLKTIEAMIASFLAASRPSTSAVGSASA